jgi:hypothetical protein
MSNEIRCVFLKPTNKVRHSLRRYSAHWGVCDKFYVGGYHNASVDVGEEPFKPSLQFDWCHDESNIDKFPHDDNKWPRVCPCGYQFVDSDEWQQNFERVFYCIENGREWTLRDAPVGAMWYAPWLNWKGPDDQCLVVKTPGGEWPVDATLHGSKLNEHGWTRTGIPPTITVRPSILIGGLRNQYHGVLTEGILREC